MAYDLKKLIDLLHEAASAVPAETSEASASISRPQPDTTNVIVSLTLKTPEA